MSYYATLRVQNKKKSQAAHAKKRVAERYNVCMTDEDLRMVVKMIQKGQCVFIERQSLRVSMFDVVIKDKVFRLVYDKKRKSVVTFLPKENL